MERPTAVAGRRAVRILSPVRVETVEYARHDGVSIAFQVFGIVYLMTGTGGQQAGGPNNTTLMTVVYLYRLAFEQFKMGYGSALAWVLFGVIMVFTLIQLKLSDAWVYYEGKK